MVNGWHLPPVVSKPVRKQRSTSAFLNAEYRQAERAGVEACWRAACRALTSHPACSAAGWTWTRVRRAPSGNGPRRPVPLISLIPFELTSKFFSSGSSTSPRFACSNVTSRLFDHSIRMDSNEANGHAEIASRYRRILRLLTAIRHELLCPAAQYLRPLNTIRQE